MAKYIQGLTEQTYKINPVPSLYDVQRAYPLNPAGTNAYKWQGQFKLDLASKIGRVSEYSMTQLRNIKGTRTASDVVKLMQSVSDYGIDGTVATESM